MLSAADIVGRKGVTHLVELPLIGGHVYVRTPLVKDRDALDAFVAKNKGSFKGAREWVLRHLVCSQDGSPLFSPDEDLAGIPAAEIEPAIDKAFELLGLSKRTDEGKASGGPSGDSSTGSPPRSE